MLSVRSPCYLSGVTSQSQARAPRYRRYVTGALSTHLAALQLSTSATILEEDIVAAKTVSYICNRGHGCEGPSGPSSRTSGPISLHRFQHYSRAYSHLPNFIALLYQCRSLEPTSDKPSQG